MSEGSAVLIVGGGAVGAVIGYALSKQGAQVSVTCRSDYDAVKRGGYVIESPKSTVHFTPANVLHGADEFKGHADYLVLCVKVTPDIDRVALIRPAVSAGTCVVLIENGIDIEEEIAVAFPNNELASAAAYVGVSRAEPGRILTRLDAQLTLGSYPRSAGAATRKFAAMCEAGGVPTRVTENLQTARWQKAVWNAVFNPASVLGGVADTKVILGNEERLRFIRTSMNEVAAVAAAAGFPVREGFIEQNIHGTQAISAYKTSMALDFENRRPMETEVILGNVVRAARKFNVATPSLDALYALMQMLEITQRS